MLIQSGFEVVKLLTGNDQRPKFRKTQLLIYFPVQVTSSLIDNFCSSPVTLKM